MRIMGPCFIWITRWPRRFRYAPIPTERPVTYDLATGRLPGGGPSARGGVKNKVFAMFFWRKIWLKTNRTNYKNIGNKLKSPKMTGIDKSRKISKPGNIEKS